MNWEAISAVGEIVGAGAVVVSLIYLSIQIRQNTKASKAATVQDMTNKWVQINLWSAESPERRFKMTDLDPSSAEFLQGLALYRALFHQWANNLYQFNNGVLDEASFKPTIAEIQHILSVPQRRNSFSVAWMAAKHIYHEDFQNLFESLLAESKGSDE